MTLLGYLKALKFKTPPPGTVMDVGALPEPGAACARCGTWLLRFGVQIRPDNGTHPYWLGPDCAGSLRVFRFTANQRARFKAAQLTAYSKGINSVYAPILRDEILPLLTEEQKINVLSAANGGDIPAWGVRAAIWGGRIQVPEGYLPQLREKYPLNSFPPRW